MTFTWNSVPGAQAYYLLAGTTIGGGEEIYTAYQGLATSRAVPMTNRHTGQGIGPNTPVYVRLWTNFGGSDWRQADVQYVTSATFAGPTEPTPAQIQSPTPGSTLTTPTVTFTWNGVPGAQTYYLVVGTSMGGGEEIYVANQGSATSRAVPMTNRYTGQAIGPNTPVYVRLWTNFGGGDWRQSNVQYVTSGSFAGPSETMPAQIQSPTPDSTLTTSPVTFTWNSVAGAQAYYLLVGTTVGGGQEIYTANQGLATSRSVDLVRRADQTPIAPGTPVYVRLWTNFGGSDWRQTNYSYQTAVGSGVMGAARAAAASVSASKPVPASPVVADPGPPLPAGVTPPPGVQGSPAAAAPTSTQAAEPPLPANVPLPPGVKSGGAPSTASSSSNEPALPAGVPLPPGVTGSKPVPTGPSGSSAPQPSPSAGPSPVAPMLVQGTVTGSDGKPLAGARVQALVGTVVCGEAVTDAAGSVQLSVLPATQRAGCGTAGAAVLVRLANGTASQSVTFQPGATTKVALRATSAAGR